MALLRSPEPGWRALEEMPTALRFQRMTELIWLVSPDLWEQLARWVPRRESLARAEWLAAELAASSSFRLRRWLDAIEA